MLARPSRYSSLLAAASLLAPAGAQERTEVAAQPTFVLVEAFNGEPLANAVVTIAGCVPHLGVVAGPVDVQQVQSDARGRARARLQPGLCYVAWATGPADPKSRCEVSPVRGWFAAGAMFTLRCGVPDDPRTFAVSGLSAWRDRGPLQIVAMTPQPGIETKLDVRDDDTVTAPPGPWDVIVVRSANGETLWSVPVSKGAVEIPPPQQLRVRVADDQGAASAGAVVRHRVGRAGVWRFGGVGGTAEPTWRDVATTDAEGRCTLVVPYGDDPLRSQAHGELVLSASRPGGPATFGGVLNGAIVVDDAKAQDAIGDELPFKLHTIEPLAGRAPGLPSGTVARLVASCKLQLSRSSFQHDQRVFTAPLSPTGEFAFTDVPPAVATSRLAFVLPAGGARDAWTFLPQRGRQLPPEVVGGGSLAGAAADVTLRVSDAGGGPARGMVAAIVPVERNGVSARDAVTGVALDPRGTATIPLVTGKWVVVLANDTGWVAQTIDVGRDAFEVALAMKPLATMRVEARNAAGEPAVGARVMTRGMTVRGTRDPVQEVLSMLRSHVQRDIATLYTDGDGRVVIPFMPVESVLQRVSLEWAGGASAEFALEQNQDWFVVGPK